MIIVDNFTRVNNDVNGNPRYVISWLSLGLDKYEASKKTREAGLKIYRGKNYGGGFIFQSYSLEQEVKWLNDIFYPKK